MTTIVQDRATIFKRVKGSSVPAGWRKQLRIKPTCVLNIIFEVVEEEEKPKRKHPTHEEIKAWSDTLPTMELTEEQRKSAEEGMKDIREGRYKRMTAEEFRNRS